MSGNGRELIRGLVHPRLILCEGEGDKSFFQHLVTARGLPQFGVHFPVKPRGATGGRLAFGQMLTALTTVSGFARLGGIIVVSDNDDSPEDSFRVVAEQIDSARGYVAPEGPLAVARAAHTPPLVVLMLPWVRRPGALETLCLEAAYRERPRLKACLDSYAGCTGVSAWSATKQLKMRMRCALSASSESDPNTPLTYAWSRPEQIIPLTDGCFDQVADFLRGFDAYVAAPEGSGTRAKPFPGASSGG